MTRNCDQCRKPYTTERCRLRQGRGRFCSHPCASRWHAENDPATADDLLSFDVIAAELTRRTGLKATPASCRTIASNAQRKLRAALAADPDVLALLAE